MHPELRDIYYVSVQLNKLVEDALERLDKGTVAKDQPFCESLALHSAARSARLGFGVTALIGAGQVDPAITLLRPQFEAQLNYLCVITSGAHGDNCSCSLEGRSYEWWPSYEKKMSVVEHNARRRGFAEAIRVLRWLSKQGRAPSVEGIEEYEIEEARAAYVDLLNAAVHSERAIMRHWMSRPFFGGDSEMLGCQIIFLSVTLQLMVGRPLAFGAEGDEGTRRIDELSRRNGRVVYCLRKDCCC